MLKYEDKVFKMALVFLLLVDFRKFKYNIVYMCMWVHVCVLVWD